MIWMPDVGGADFANVKNAAMGLANGEKFWTYSYFSTSINNANIAIFLSVLYRIIPTWTGIVFIGALFTNFSAVFVSLTIRNYTKNNKLSLLCLWGSELILAMTWRAYLVYTDNFGMLFVAMTLWIISLKLKYQIKIPLVIVFISFASYIKVTNFLLFLCLVIYYFCNHIGENTKDNLKKILYGFICFCVIFGGVIGGQKILRHHYELMQDEYAKGWQYMFMVGQNTEAFGVVNGNDGDIRVKFIDMYESGAEVRLACRDEAFARIRERRVVGNMKYYLCKLDVAYGDGYFHNIHTTDEYNRSDFFSKIYMLDGKWYWVLANLLQIVWNGILLSLLAGAWINKKTNNIINLYYLFILAVTLYLLCFEGRSKYIYVFTYIHSSGGIIV